MLYFRACPKCKTGAIQFKSDWDGNRLVCLNCGFALAQPPATRNDNGEPTIVASGRTDKDGVAA